MLYIDAGSSLSVLPDAIEDRIPAGHVEVVWRGIGAVTERDIAVAAV